MKTFFTAIALVAFSALMLSPQLPETYPPKKVVEMRKEIVCKEQEINGIIKEIECNLAVDSIAVKKHNYGK
ncbi:MAG: hypothetical protein B7Y83_00180 [Flavobacteriales bacterium 32-34-25]|nr:MAG: hypothetical protein B7Y83_00180 [Flavobacteriales bacterium 32-34-25]